MPNQKKTIKNRVSKQVYILFFSVLFSLASNIHAQQYCILKADDFSEFKNNTTKKTKYLNFINTVKEKEVVAGLGFIGKALENPSNEFVTFVQGLNNSKKFEFWNHGYDHGYKKDDAEFSGKSYDYQYGKMKRAQDVVKDKFGITMHSFGAPGNNVDAITADVIRDIPEIKTWLYNKNITPPQGVLGLPLRINIENSSRVVSLASFKELYAENSTTEYLLSQLHPHAWSANSLVEFGKIIDFLKSKNVVFILPYDYYLLKANTLATDEFNTIDFSIYPNPSTDEITIQIPQDIKVDTINIFDMQGKLVYTQNDQLLDRKILLIPNLVSGVYNVVVVLDKETISKKIIIE